MTALSTNRLRSGREVTSITMGVKAATHIYSGAMVFNDAGFLRGGTPTILTPVVGLAQGEADNSSGANGDIKVTAERGKAYGFANGAGGDALTAADIGKRVFAIDDNTVGKTDGGGTRPVAGTLVAFGADSVPWVKLDAEVGLGLAGTAGGKKIASGVAAVTGTLTVATGLTTVTAVEATSQDDMDGTNLAAVSATIGDQNGAPVAGSIILKAWKITAGGNAALIAATAAKNINWKAYGV